MRSVAATACLALLVLTSCSGDGETGTDADSSGTTTANAGGGTEGIDVCTLLTAEELIAGVGSAPASRPTEPIGGLTGCSWGVGLVIVQIRNTATLVTAPLEADCPSANIGEQSTVCFGSVKFLTSNDIQATISTIEPLEESQLLAIATTLLPKLEG